MKPRVFVVVLNWNGKNLTKKCLKSLKKQTLAHTTIVVDNGSKDGSTTMLEEDFPDVVLIKNPKNYGFSGGANIGIKYAMSKKADLIALLNNDAIADPRWLENLSLEMGNNQQAGIVTGKLLRSDKKHFDSTGDYYSTRGIPFPRGRNTEDKGQYDKREQVFGATGGASLYNVKMLKEIGLFDERFFAYYEDVDISFRARLADWKVIYAPDAIAYHEVSATSSKLGNFAHYHSNKNFYFLYIKNMPAKLFWRYLHSFLYQAVRSFASSMISLRIGSYFKAIGVVLLKLPFVLWDRHKIQKNRKVTPGEIELFIHQGKPPISPRI